MSLWILWRLVKLLSVVLFAGGVTASIFSRAQEDRLTAAQYLTTLGFWGAWVAGFQLMKMTQRSMEPWIVAGMLASFLAFHGSLFYAHKVVPRFVTGAMAMGGLLACTAVMVVRPSSWLEVVVSLSAGFVVGGALTLLRPQPEDQPSSHEQVQTWFQWVARLEGLSLLLLMLAMPLKHLGGVTLDGGTGLLGGSHGLFAMIYAQALLSGGRALGWSWKTVGLGLVCALVPFGSFWFERRQRPARL